MPPGSRFIYSDVGFLVLGEIVRRISGQDLHQFSRDHVFGPLRMTETGYLPQQRLRQRAAPTEKRDDRWIRGEVHDPRAYLLSGIAGHAGLFSTAEDLAVQLTIKKLKMPEALADDVLEYVRQVLTTCERLYEATGRLMELAEADFGGEPAERVLEIARQAEHEEWVADKMQYKLAQRLFALEDELKPTDIFLWSGIFQNLGALANHADKSAERLRRMLAR